MEKPSERRAQARTAVVWSDLAPTLAGGPLDVLDIGGGTGGFAVRVAGQGHRVTVIDPSPDALAALDNRAREQGVVVTGQQGDLAELLDLVGESSFDVVLCHGVLEVVPDPAAALATLQRVLHSGGLLSLLAGQRYAAVIARATAGHFAQAQALLDEQVPGRHRFTAEELGDLVTAAGFTTESVHGVRVFADLVPGSLLDLEPGSTQALVDLEQAVARRPEFLPLATQVHVLARS